IAAAVAFAMERAVEDVARRNEASAGFEPSAPAIGTWEWEVSSRLDNNERGNGLPSGTLRQVRQCSVESSRDGMKILDVDGRLIYINPAGLEHLGVEDPNDLLHRPLVEF